MKNKSNFLWIALILVFLVIFNVVVFLTTSEFTVAFWVSYGFIHFAYLMLVISCSAMPKAKNAVVLGYPMIYLSFVYFVAAFIVGLIFMLFKNASFNLAFIPQLIIAGVYAFLYISNMLANESTMGNESKEQDEIFYVKTAAAEISQIMNQPGDISLKKKLEKLYDSIRSSQVKSHPALAGIEYNIIIKIEELKEKVNSNDYTAANSIIDSLLNLLNERNNKISLMR